MALIWLLSLALTTGDITVTDCTHIPQPVQDQMDAICRAVITGEIAVMECTHHETNEPVYVLCAVRQYERDNETHYNVMPIAVLDGTDPYEFVVPPAPFTHIQTTEEMH